MSLPSSQQVSLRELQIRVKTKETFKEFFNDRINVERDLAASSALRKNKNSDYLKMDDSINNRNNKTVDSTLHKITK